MSRFSRCTINWYMYLTLSAFPILWRSWRHDYERLNYIHYRTIPTSQPQGPPVTGSSINETGSFNCRSINYKKTSDVKVSGSITCRSFCCQPPQKSEGPAWSLHIIKGNFAGSAKLDDFGRSCSVGWWVFKFSWYKRAVTGLVAPLLLLKVTCELAHSDS